MTKKDDIAVEHFFMEEDEGKIMENPFMDALREVIFVCIIFFMTLVLALAIVGVILQLEKIIL